jgi:hypothetical protein
VLDGVIGIWGSLQNGPQTDDIAVGSIGAGAITIDWNGWNSGDDWASGALIKVGDTTYAYNDPNIINTNVTRLWHTTPCRGDVNNDGAVTFADIDPFVLAIGIDPNDPNSMVPLEQFFPGRSGSGLYHGDLNLDHQVTFADIDPLVSQDRCAL